MINAFPTSDPLHLLELGIMKRCLARWAFGEKGFSRKMSRAHFELASRLIQSCQKQMPTDFHRKLRRPDTLRRWKGVESRTMLLYVGMVVFKRVLDEDLYAHFLLLCCAVRYCSSNLYKKYQDAAKEMFGVYVKNYSALYGKHTVGSNVHNLLHIVQDLKKSDIGNLIEISTYKFENCLRLLGSKLKHGYLPLEQIAHRIIESSSINNNNYHHDEQLPSCRTKKIEPLVSYEIKLAGNEFRYEKIQITPEVTLSIRKFGDSWFSSKSGQIVKMKYALKIGNNFKIVGQNIIEKNDFFTKPVNSSKLDIFLSNGELDDQLNSYNLQEIEAKIICLPYGTDFVFIPLLHTMDNLAIWNYN